MPSYRDLYTSSAIAAGLLFTAAALAAPAAAQASSSSSPSAETTEPVVLHACYVPATGTVYRIKEPGLREECSGPPRGPNQHVEFSWTEGVPGHLHANLDGLAADDHPQYLLADGVRHAADGFAVTGTIGTGTIPASGPGARLMWHAGKAAFRAGRATGSQWDDENIGNFSVALGSRTIASAPGSIATGAGTIASGHVSTAMGSLASTNGFAGAFVYGDASTSLTGGTVTASRPNQFVVRASGGFRFRTSFDLHTGCDLPLGSGTFECTSTRAAKTDFEHVEGESVLTRLASFPIQSWTYRNDPSGARHIGPTAEDFRAAFGLGTDETTIAMMDEAGVALLAVQALERRTRELAEATDALEEHERRIRTLEDRLRALEVRLDAGAQGSEDDR